MTEAVYGLVGVVLGAAIGVALVLLRRRAERELAQRLLDDMQKGKADELASMLEQVKAAFGALSRDALSANTDDFLKLAKTKFEQQTTQADQTLETKKKLIDARLEDVAKRLTEFNGLVQQIEKQRAETHGNLRGQLEKATQATNRLHETTGQLREALASPKRRGQWGERMAEDVLRLAGFVEDVNYRKQKKLSEGGIPDFTFMLPDNQCVHMDVKFPLDNYLKVLEAPDDAARTASTQAFLRDVRTMIKGLTTRAYIDPAAGTVDYVLVFIPNEQVYGFIHEHDGTLLDDALRMKVVLCSPLTLYAILAVIRQSVDNFRLQRASTDILNLLAEFKKQWSKYVDGMDKMGDKLDAAVKEYQTLVGTRTRQLERQLDKIDDLREASVEQAAALLPDAARPTGQGSAE